MTTEVLTERSGAVGGMDSSPALYMCFRCYQLFDSLDDVLFHQYTLHPNDVGDEENLALPPGPQTESDEMFQCVPCWVLFSSREELIRHQQSDGCSQHSVGLDWTNSAQSGPTPHPSSSTANQQNSSTLTEQNHTKSLTSVLKPQAQNQNRTLPSGPEQPLRTSLTGTGSGSQIQFQCGDCGCLFESLAPWLQHRKLKECCRTGSEPGKDGEKEHEAVEVAKGPEDGHGVDETGTGDVQSASEKEPPDSQDIQEGAETQNPKPNKLGTKRKKTAEAAAKAPVVACRSFLCADCGAGFNWQPALVAHRRTQHGLEEALHNCLECGESFMNTALFVLHCKKHREKRGRIPRAKRSGLGLSSLENKQGVENGGGEKEIIRRRATKRKVRLRKLASSSYLDPAAEAVDGFPPGRRPRRKRGAPQECPHCRRAFSNPRYLRAHVLSHSGQKQFRCEVCGKAFTYQNNLRRHLILHSGTRPYMCDRCGKTFTQSSHLKDHLRNHDRVYGWSRPRDADAGAGEWTEVGPKLPHPCPDCPRSFMTQSQLLMHRKMCPICERAFKWRGSLPAHIVRHTDNKLFSCDVCGKTFSYQTNLARHLIIHTGTRPYACSHCGKTFNQSSNLRQHLLVHAKAGGRRQPVDQGEGVGGDEAVSQLIHTCPDCTLSFKTQAQLQKHRLSHTGQDSISCSNCGLPSCKCQEQENLPSVTNQDGEVKSCPRCSAQFDSQPALDSHAQSCPAEGGRGRAHRRGRRRKSARQTECDLCGRCCTSQEELEAHQLSHVGQSQLQCPLSPCQRRFTSSSALQNHLFSHFPGPTCRNLRPERLVRSTARAAARTEAPEEEEEVEGETTVAVIPLWEVYASDPPPAGP